MVLRLKFRQEFADAVRRHRQELEAGTRIELVRGGMQLRCLTSLATRPLVKKKVLVEENGFEPSGLGFVDPADAVSPPLALSNPHHLS